MSYEYIQYPGYMTDEILEFCGRENVISENRDGIPVSGYFLKNAIGPRTMFMTRFYIIKRENGLSIEPRLPDE